MIPKECKRLAEVDFPIATVSQQAVREKSIRHGHPSTLHLWWARRPLASSRAMLMALLLPDPCDPHCPTKFKEEARRALIAMHGRPTGWEEKAKTDLGLRRVILEFIASFSDWDRADDRTYIAVSRGLVRAANGTESPLVVDPFAGGGSIPLEALRIGCDALASDLNPVACTIMKTLLEDIPRHGLTLADRVREIGDQIFETAKANLAEYYPRDQDGSYPITYIWARTVQCESPNCGAEIPLLGSLWLCKKRNRKCALRYRVIQESGSIPRIEFEVFEPKTEPEVQAGTIRRVKATCPCCTTVLQPERVRAQLGAAHGGADVVFDDEGRRIGGARIAAVVTAKRGKRGRDYRLPTQRDYLAVYRAETRLSRILRKGVKRGTGESAPVPDEPLPLMSGTFNVPLYGMNSWGDLFSSRQKVALQCLSNLVSQHWDAKGDSEEPESLISATASLLALLVDRVAIRCTANCMWDSTTECIMQIFNQGQALPFRSEFAEMVPISEEGSGWTTSIGYGCKVIEASVKGLPGQVLRNDALSHPLPDQTAGVWFTDPPYYFAVPYADLSDFFFVWLKRTVPNHSILRGFISSKGSLTPKDPELCEMARWDNERYGHKDKQFFEDGMANAFVEGRRVLREDGIGSVVFAHKTTEGWEALLSGMIRGGWTITGSWPIATESRNRLRAQNSAALATSVHLVCRPRPENAGVGDWADVLRELPVRVAEWMERLQAEGIRGADLVFACVGPALEVFSRYTAVETAEGEEVGLPTYLERVWEVVGRTALENVLGTAEARARNGQTGVLEEDARLTALFLWTLQSTDTNTENGTKDREEEAPNGAKKAKGFTLPFDVVRRFAQPMGINLDTWTNRIIGQNKGVVRLLPVRERGQELFGKDGASAAADWIETDPATAAQLTLFPEPQPVSTPRKGRGRRKAIVEEGAELESIDATTLDRVHAAMLLQASGRATALRNWIEEEQQRGPDFLRLANSLSALYPPGTDEKRLLDAMLLAMPR